MERSPARVAWRAALPVLRTRTAVPREVTSGDARSLNIALSTLVRQYLPAGPTTEDQFARFIRWVRRERRSGRYVCFAVRSRTIDVPLPVCFSSGRLNPVLTQRKWALLWTRPFGGTGTFIDCATAGLVERSMC